MYVADLHIHSNYSRATSRDCVPEGLAWWAGRKGIGLVGTGDFTHPAWREELAQKLEPAEEGFYVLKPEFARREPLPPGAPTPRFVITGEISSIYKKNGKVRKVHSLILLPGLEDAQRLAVRLEAVGNLHSDGRPILGLDSRDLLEITLECCPKAVFIPAHIWTPHFSLFGAYSGFDNIRDCFADLTPHIHALETGLSSDPPMNWRLSALDGYQLVSNSDAHSPSRLGREANLLDGALSYPSLSRALETGEGLYGTLEFFPEEGKYHYDGHRGCGVCQKPEDTIKADGLCPVCGKRVTVGVLHRVEALADRPEGFVKPGAKPFESLVPLPEVVAACTGGAASGKRVEAQVESILRELGPELAVLRECPAEEIERVAGPCVAEGVRRVRANQVRPFPGFDGEYGRVQILTQPEIERLNGQISWFPGVTAQPREKTAKRAGIKESLPAAERAAQPAVPPVSEPNEQQRDAVLSSARAVAVIAGPGTGKTRTLVARIAHLVEDQGVKPANLAAVTFTNQAAGELRERLEARLGKRAARAMRIGTFHGLCLQLLGEEAPTVLSEQEALAVAEEETVRLGLGCKPRSLLRRISAVKNGAPLGEESEAVQAGYRAYCAALERDHAADYDDLLLRALDQWEDPAAGRAFQHLLVDEFQDVNELQYRLIRAWSKDTGHVFVIGDPDQSIYGFRGSDSRCFDWFIRDYTPVQVVRLIRNYRSEPAIIRSALAAVAANPSTFPRRLEAVRQGKEPVRLVTAQDAFSEALFVVKEINRLVGGVDMLDTQFRPGAEPASRGFSDIAVLYRTHRQEEMLEYCLKKEGIPFAVTGREDYLSDPMVRAAIGFFRFLCSPGDRASLQSLLRGFSVDRAVAEAYRASPQTAEALLPLLRRSFELKGEKLPPVLQWMEELTGGPGGRKPALLLEEWRKRAGCDDSPAMERLVHAAVYHRTMAEFLHILTMGGEGDISRSGAKRVTGDAVALMTLHGAKGLEFPVVFLCGLNRGVLPLEMPGRECDLPEERRLFYVGMTRAKDALYLLAGPDPSPFVADLPQAELVSSGADRRKTGQQLSLFS